MERMLQKDTCRVPTGTRDMLEERREGVRVEEGPGRTPPPMVSGLKGQR